MKNYSIEGDIIVCNTWFGVAELHMDYGLFRNIHMLKFISEIDKVRAITFKLKTLVESKDFKQTKEITEKFIKENNISSNDIVSILKSADEYEKYIDELPNLVPESLKGKKLILTGLQTNSFRGPKIIQL